MPYQQEIEGKEQITAELTKGSVTVFVQDEIFLIDIIKVHTDPVFSVKLEPTIQGSELALSEDLSTNLNLIRQRYHQPSLTVTFYQIPIRYGWYY
nr:spore germination protein [uncultured Bacillus sp.]